MKVYLLKYHQLLINELLVDEERFIEQYKTLFEELLSRKTLCSKRLYECINLQNGAVSSNPLTIAVLMSKKILPPFKFLCCKN